MKISNLFESTVNYDFSDILMRYTDENSYKVLMIVMQCVDYDEDAMKMDNHAGLIYLYVMLTAHQTKNSLNASGFQSHMYRLLRGSKAIDVKELVTNFHEHLVKVFKAVKDELLLNSLSASPKSADELYKHMLDNPVQNGDTLREIAYDLKDYAVELADDLQDKGFTYEQIWGKYPVTKFEYAFLTFVRKRIEEGVA